MGLLAITTLGTSLPHYSAEAQSIPIPEFKPKAPEPTGPPPTDFAMKVQLKPDENKTDADRGEYQVSDFALEVSNSSDLCPPPITIPGCEFELEGEMWGPTELSPGKRFLSGTLEVDTGDYSKTMLLYAEWPVEESNQAGQTVQVINGTLDAGTDMAFPEYQSQINGTLVSDGNDLILAVHGTATGASAAWLR